MTIPMCCVCGPFIEYIDYKDFINQDNFFKKIPSSVKQSLNAFLQALVSMILNVGLPILFISPF
jgi:hypothetical protein